MQTRWARVARGLAAALVATFVAAFMHALAGGARPGVLGLALALSCAVPFQGLVPSQRISVNSGFYCSVSFDRSIVR